MEEVPGWDFLYLKKYLKNEIFGRHWQYAFVKCFGSCIFLSNADYSGVDFK